MSNNSAHGFSPSISEPRLSWAGIHLRSLMISLPSKMLSKIFSGLKAGISTESEVNFFNSETSAVLRSTITVRKSAEKRQIITKSGQASSSAKSLKGPILGAAGGIGQPLSLLLKMVPLISVFNLYDIANVKGVAADLSHCNSFVQFQDFTGPTGLADFFKCVDLVVIPAGVP